MNHRGPEAELRDFARLQVRAGLLGDDVVLREVRDAIASDLPGADAAALAAAWVESARAELAVEQATWARPTDHERLQDCFAACEAEGLRVLQGIADHWVAKAELDRLSAAGQRPKGILWFTPPDVWHAVDEGMLEVNLWHPDTANVAPGEKLLDVVLGQLRAHGLAAHFDEGRIEVDAHWRCPR